MKLLLGIPTAGSPAAPFLESLAALTLPPGTELERFVVTGNYVPAQRDLIAERALERGVDAVVMCDDDMVLPPDAVTQLCVALSEHPRAAIAGALYYSRDGFRPMAVDCWNERDTRTAVIPAFDREPVAVDGIGFGCVVIRAAALRELMPPFFPSHVFVERSAGRVRVCDEDYLFCARLRKAGWQVLLHAGVRCGHYDRAQQRTAPIQWESAERTNRVRMAVIENGKHALVDYRDVAESTPESQIDADLRYVIVP